MPKPKQLTPDDIKSGIYTLSYMEETLGGSRLTWAKFIRTFPNVFLLIEENKNLKKFKTNFSKEELISKYVSMKSQNVSKGRTDRYKNILDN